MEEKDIIEKIRKLMALSESTNENEAKVAILKVQELLSKHKLSMLEVEREENQVVRELTEITFTKAKWKISLANLIGENFSSYVYAMTNKTNKIVFLGLEDDVKIARIVLEYAIEIISKEVGKLRYEYRKKGFSTRGLENDYANGFIFGLKSSLNRQKSENQDWALILVKDESVIRAFEEIKFSKSISIREKKEKFLEVYEKGIREGEKFSIRDKLNSNN